MHYLARGKGARTVVANAWRDHSVGKQTATSLMSVEKESNMNSRLSIIIVLTLIGYRLNSRLTIAQRLSSFTGTARGQGTLTAGQEKYKINSVRIDLKEDGNAE